MDAQDIARIFLDKADYIQSLKDRIADATAKAEEAMDHFNFAYMEAPAYCNASLKAVWKDISDLRAILKGSE